MDRFLAIAGLTVSLFVGSWALLTDLYGPCCLEGIRWSTFSGDCGSYAGLVNNVTDADYPVCVSIVEVCCLREVHQRQCLAGKEAAADNAFCATRLTDPGAEQFQQCCHCCRLGLEVSNARLSCVAPNFGHVCDRTFLECCTGSEAHSQQNGQTTANNAGYLGQRDSTSGGSERRPDGSALEASRRLSGGSDRRSIVSATDGDRRSGGGAGLAAGTDNRLGGILQGDDRDECALFPNQLCAQLCINTAGSFRCDCSHGYVLDRDGRTCTANGPAAASPTAAQPSVITCALSNPCEQECFDTPQGMQCGCYPGYELDNSGAYCRDINECISSAACRPGETCANTQGSYTCTTQGCPTGTIFNPVSRLCEPNRDCPRGYEFASTSNKCEDLDECALGIDHLCGEGMRCENTDGAYVCRRDVHCGTGYTMDESSQRCLDNNECLLGTHNCGRGYECQNTEGSFRCRPQDCTAGHRFNPTSGECERIVCRRGLRPDAAGNCIDINECLEHRNVCAPYQTCINSVGSYSCRSSVNCPNGFRPNAAGRCVDIDECAEGSHMCGSEQQCTNRQGSYLCQCPTGHRADSSGRCADIDECAYGAAICPANSRCSNTVGSFVCVCNEGLLEDRNGRCLDINECERENICQQNCVNVLGTYFCSCERGYQLNSDGRTCDDIDECQEFGRGGSVCGGECINTIGSYQCECPAGWRIKRDSRSCEDIDECAEGTSQCSERDSVCVNTRGGHKCPVVVCPEGFIKTPAGGGRNSIRCKSVSTDCPECLRGLRSLSYNFLTFPANVVVPANLFSMSGALDKKFSWRLAVESARPSRPGVTPANANYFSLTESRNHAVVSLVQRLDAPQDVELKLTMNITNLFGNFEGLAESHITLYITEAAFVRK